MNPAIKIGQTRIRPTAYGWTFLFLLVWVPLAGIATANNFLLIIFFLMIGLAAISHWLAVRNIASVRIVRRFPEEVFAGASFAVTYAINTDSKPWGAVTLKFEEDTPLADTNGAVVCAGVAANETAAARGNFTVPGRGDVVVGPGTLSSAFPFGLAEYSRRLGPSDYLLVFPRIEPLDEKIPSQVGGMGRGMERTDVFGTIPFQFRYYVPGDPYKHIDWKKSAASGVSVTKVLSEESAKEITIRLPADASEPAISRAASLVVHFSRSRTPICLEGPGVRIGPGHGGGFIRELLTALARWEKVAAGAQTEGRPRGPVVVVEQSGALSWKGPGGRDERAA